MSAHILSATWARRRRRLVILFIGMGALVFAGLWLVETQSGLITPFDRHAYPVVILFLLVNLAIMIVRPPLQPAVELSCYTGVALYLLAQLLPTLGGSDHGVYTVANTLQWMPALYVAAFMLFSRRRALIAGGGTFVASALVLGSAAVAAGARGDVSVAALLANAVVAHLLTLLLLSIVMMMQHEIERISMHARTMESAANTDPLTGIANRRALEEWLRDWEREGDGSTAALVLFDIDHFKAVNDLHGHLVGDEILVSAAQLIRSQLRARDLVGRWGGEEFLVIIEGGTLENATALANRVRQIVMASVHPVAGSVTLSAGVAVCTADTPVDAAFKAADDALYAAKAAGRNRVEAS